MSAAVADAPGPHAPQQVRGACPHDCPDTCALVTTVDDGVAVKVQGNPEHRPTDGVLCTKVSRYPERTYHPERVLHAAAAHRPQGLGPVRAGELGRGAGRHRGAPAATSPRATRRPSCPTATAAPWAWCRARAWRRASSTGWAPRCSTAPSAPSAGGEALVHTLGGKVGMKVEFFAEARLILIWGSNSIASNLHFWRLAQEAKRRGARLVCIDPRRTETAEKCHEHLQLLPGTDAALALALMHELIAQRLAGPRLHRAAHAGLGGAARARAALDARARRRRLRHRRRSRSATWRATTAPRSPAAIRLNYGMQRVHGGGNAVRAVACLPALMGAWRHRAGGLLLSSSGWASRCDRRRCSGPTCWPAARPARINMVTIGDDLLRAVVARVRPAGRGGGRLQQQPGGGGARVGARWCAASRARTCSPWCWSISGPTPPTTPTTCCRPPRSWSTGTCTPPTATPTCCSTGRPSRRWARPGPTRRCSASWPRAWASPTPALPTATRRCAARPSAAASTSTQLLRSGFAHAAAARCAVRARRLPHAVGPLRVLQRRAGAPGPGRPARPRAQPRGRRHARRATRWR